MRSPIADLRHLSFLLHEVLEVEQLRAWPRYAAHDRESFDAAIALAHRIALERFWPHNRKSDLQEPHVVDGRVVLVPEVEPALAAFNEAGFPAALADFEDGGMQLPFVVVAACDALFAAANPGTVAYPMLARAAANLLEVYATPAQRERWWKPIVEGRYYGTMCLSEPHAGSSLADLATTAVPREDGDYAIRGAKMWISAGDHELGENIVHLVLARIAGAPAGVRGISLFAVPRWRVDAEGRRVARNDVRLAGLNHKMGQRGSVNTFLKFGEADDCVGELVGKPHEGLAAMFHMMNEERIGVGIGAVQQGHVGYLHALAYAFERRQGRHPDQKDPSSPPVPIVEHADVRRMLLAQRAWVEGAQLLCYVAAKLVDEQRGPDPAAAEQATLLLELLTPVVKAWGSDVALRANDLAIQVLGGAGYTRDHPVEQCYRDNRINPIHEGTNGIQALDLLGRKAMMQGGAAVRLLLARLEGCAARAAADPQLAGFAEALRGGAARIEAATRASAARLAAGELRAGLANAHAYLLLVGTVCGAWMWLEQALAARRGLAGAVSAADEAFYRGKLQTCRWYYAVELPTIAHLASLVIDGERSALDMRADWF